jgi:hypothetical protein
VGENYEPKFLWFVKSELIEPTDESKRRKALRLGWSGMVEAPNGIAGFILGSFGIPTALTEVNNGGSQEDGPAGGRERSVNGQLLLANFDEFSLSVNQSTVGIGISSLVEGFSDSASVIADQVGGYDDAPFSPDSHTVQSQHDTLLLSGQHAGFSGAIVNKGVTNDAPISNSGTLVDKRAIAVSSNDISGHLAAGSSDGTVTDLDVFKLKQVALEPFVGLDALGSEGSRLIVPLFVVEEAAGLGKNERQEDKHSLQHHLSFGSLTLLPDRKSVNQYAI